MADLLTNNDPTIRERVCMALKTIAGLGDGKEAIVQNKLILENLSKLLHDDEAPVRIKAVALLEMVSRAWMYADVLVDNDFIPQLLETLMGEETEIQAIILQTLSQLMYCHGKDQALGLGAFDMFVSLLEHDNEQVQAGASECLMMICSTRAGKKLSYKHNIYIKLARLLKSDNPEVYSAAAAALMFCVVKTKAKVKASKIKVIPKRLVEICKDWHNTRAQIFAMKALTCMCEHPGVKKFVYENHFNELENCVVFDEDLRGIKKVLIDVVSRVPALY